MLQAVLTPSSTNQEINLPTIHSSQPIPDPLINPSHSEQLQQVEDISKNRRWSEEEHILYVLFLEQNREKIKSKLIRRSNSFFKDMAAFIKTKVSTQCRSYHQKYELKYKYPHRIIRQQREKLNSAAYQELKMRISSRNDQTLKCGQIKKQPEKRKVQTHEYECQTTIQGISTVFVHPDLDQAYYCQQQFKSCNYLYPYSMNYPPMGMYYHHPYYSL